MTTWLELIANRLEDAPSARGRLAPSPQYYVYVLCRADGVRMAVENGVGRDILSNGMAPISDATIGAETLALTAAGFRYIVSELGRPMLEDASVLHPDLGKAVR